MKQRIRVAVAAALWVLLFLGVAVCGVYLLGSGAGAERNIALGTPMSGDAAEGASKSPIAVAEPAEVGFDADAFAAIDRLVERCIDEGLMPGAVVGVMRHDKIVYARAFGNREVADEVVPMTLDTRFDIASMTKPIATATSIVQLVERGVIRLNERVDSYIPDFEGWADTVMPHDTAHIRILDLLTHTSGLPAYATARQIVAEYPGAQLPDRDTVIEYVAHVPRLSKPRSECRYSCLNYVVLAEIVHRASGLRLDDYARQNIFEPLGMHHTCFVPDADYAHHCAPTARAADGTMLRGVVHDPLAREAMGGVSGNAGLFSTLNDLLLYARMILNNGAWNGCGVLSPRSVMLMLNEPRGFEEWDRTVGWESFKGYSSTAGDLLSDSAVGHTGATGTSIVIDPELDLAIVILTNKVHGASRGYMVELRSRIATIVGAAIVE